MYMANVQIYSTPTCMYCKLAKEYFKNHNVEYVEHNVATDLVRRKELVDKSGQMGVPVIDIDGNIVIGFDEPRLAELLKIGQ